MRSGGRAVEHRTVNRRDGGYNNNKTDFFCANILEDQA